MKKLVAILAAAMLAVLAIVPMTGAMAESENAQVMGGWTVNADDPTVIPEDVQNAFTKAMEGFVGSNLEPVAYLGSQVVSGTNYCLLCKGTTVTQEPTVYYAVVTIYQDLNGGAEITNIQNIELGAQ